MLTFEKLDLRESLPLEYTVSEFGDGTVAPQCYGKKSAAKSAFTIVLDPDNFWSVGICIRPQLLIKVLLD